MDIARKSRERVAILTLSALVNLFVEVIRSAASHASHMVQNQIHIPTVAVRVQLMVLHGEQ